MHLSAVQEIEHAIDALTPQEREELYEWLDQKYPQSIDQQLEADLEAGRIDDRISRGRFDGQSSMFQRHPRGPDFLSATVA